MCKPCIMHVKIRREGRPRGMKQQGHATVEWQEQTEMKRLAAPVTTPSQVGFDFDVTLDHSDNWYGFTIEDCASGAKITELYEGGLVEQWNKEQRDKVITLGDVVLSVNGIVGFDRIDAEICKPHIAKITELYEG